MNVRSSESTARNQRAVVSFRMLDAAMSALKSRMPFFSASRADRTGSRRAFSYPVACDHAGIPTHRYRLEYTLDGTRFLPPESTVRILKLISH
jgi:hypothetical protein